MARIPQIEHMQGKLSDLAEFVMSVSKLKLCLMNYVHESDMEFKVVDNELCVELYKIISVPVSKMGALLSELQVIVEDQ